MHTLHWITLHCIALHYTTYLHIEILYALILCHIDLSNSIEFYRSTDLNGQVSAFWMAPGHRTWPSSWAKWRCDESRQPILLSTCFSHEENGWLRVIGESRMKNHWNLGDWHWITLFLHKPTCLKGLRTRVWRMTSNRQRFPCEFRW